MDMTTTLTGSNFEKFLPKGWDIRRIKECVSNPLESVFDPQPFWNKDFRPICCTNLEEFGVYMGHEIAMQIRLAMSGRLGADSDSAGRTDGHVQMWVVYFLKEWNVDCGHVHELQYGRVERRRGQHRARK